MRKSRIIAIITSSVIALGGGIAFFAARGGNESVKDIKSDKDKSSHTSVVNGKNFDENNVGEIYYSPLDPNHVATDENGVMYADNELLVVAAEGVTKNEIEDLAEEYDAKIVGYIEQTGDYQWKLNGRFEKEKLIDMIKNEKEVISCSLNSVFVLGEDSVDYTLNWGEQWGIENLVPNGMNVFDPIDCNDIFWHIVKTNTYAAWEFMDKNRTEITPIKVGIIDSAFSYNHEDIVYNKLFYNGNTNKVDNTSFIKKGIEHGTHVAGIMAANGSNDKGICGVYPYCTDKNKNSLLYCVSLQGYNSKLENPSFWESSMFFRAAMAELILRNVKVINVSLGFNALALLYDDEKAKEGIKNEACLLGDYLKRLLDLGYDFIIATSAGNDSNKIVTTIDKNSLNEEARTINFSSDGEKVFVEEINDNYYYNTDENSDKKARNYKVVAPNNIKIPTFCANNDYPGYLGHLDATYNSYLCAIPNTEKYKDVYDRIIVVGALNREMDIADFSNSGPRVDIYAPGVNIYSTVAGGYDYKPGTSMSSPMAAGAAANVWSINIGLKGNEVKEIICNNPLKKGSSKYAALDVYSAVLAAKEKKNRGTKTEPQKGALSGWVFEENTNNVLEGTTIEVYKDGKRMDQTITDKNGHYDLFLDEGKYQIKAYKERYKEYSAEETIYSREVCYAKWIKLIPENSSTQSEDDPSGGSDAGDDIIEFEGHYYKVFSNPEQYDVYQSEAACRKLGGHLVSINSEAEQNFIESIFDGKDNYWIGLEYIDEQWCWMDGSPFSYTHWDVWIDTDGVEFPQPDNYEEREYNGRIAGKTVVYEDWYMNKGGWIDTDGSGQGEDLSTFGYICEWSSKPVLP